MNQKMQWTVIVWNYRVQEMVPASQVPQGSFVCPKRIGHFVPSSLIKIIRLHRGSHQPHPTSAVGHCELTPVRLPSQDSGAGGKRRLTGAGGRKKNNLFRLKIVREPGMEFPQGFGRQVRDFHSVCTCVYESFVLSYPTTAPQISTRIEMDCVAGVEPAWTCAQDMWVAATLHPDLKRGPCSPLLFSPSRIPPGATCEPRPPDR